MREVGAFEAKNRFSALLADVERGGEIVITRRGKPVARLIPAEPDRNPAAVDAAVENIRARIDRKGGKPFDWEEWKQYRDEGRR